MSTNCLVTKLKGVVVDDNLPIFKTLRIKVLNTTENAILNLDIVDNVNVKAVGGTFSLTVGGEQVNNATITSRTHNFALIYLSVGEYEIQCSSKYDMLRLVLPNCTFLNMADIGIIPSLTSFSAVNNNNITGDLNNLNGLSSLRSLSLQQSTKITGDLSSLNFCPNIEML
jgi:hypothetical protein